MFGNKEITMTNNTREKVEARAAYLNSLGLLGLGRPATEADNKALSEASDRWDAAWEAEFGNA